MAKSGGIPEFKEYRYHLIYKIKVSKWFENIPGMLRDTVLLVGLPESSIVEVEVKTGGDVHQS